MKKQWMTWPLLAALFIFLCATTSFAVSSLYVDAESFISDFNKLGEKLNTGLKSSKPQMQNRADHDTFRSSVDDHMILTGDIDKTWKLLSSVTLSRVNIGTMPGYMGIIQLIIASNLKMSPEEAQQLIDKMIPVKNLKDGDSKELVFNGQRFSYTYSLKSGLSFKVEGAE
jgi:hypothetical protein